MESWKDVGLVSLLEDIGVFLGVLEDFLLTVVSTVFEHLLHEHFHLLVFLLCCLSIPQNDVDFSLIDHLLFPEAFLPF
jgi:hypothetical protein